MTDRPILFSAPMIRALLDGRKTQTRRLSTSPLSRVEIGDLLWVKETHCLVDCDCSETCRVFGKVYYPATGDDYQAVSLNKLRPSIFMPRWASRITLTVTDKRFEPLRSIAGNDPRCEGVERAGGDWRDYSGRFPVMLSARESFQTLWMSLHDKPGERWADNPEVVALTFTVELRNIDQ